jgi:hypothetical protein
LFHTRKLDFQVKISKEKINESLEKDGYILIKNFLSPQQCDVIRKEVEVKIEEWFTKENLVSHAAYVSDDNKGRRYDDIVLTLFRSLFHLINY